MSKVYAVMLGYNNAGMVEGAMQNFDKTVSKFEVEQEHVVKVLFHCGYPLPDPQTNKDMLWDLAQKYGWLMFSIPNEGVMGNWNRAIHDYLKMKEDDFLITFDPDVRMENEGWLMAMLHAFNFNPDAMFCCAARHYHDEQWCIDQHGRTTHMTPSGIRYGKYRELIAWSMGMWRASFLNSRPRDFAQAGKYYGYSEHADYDRLKKHGKTWISLIDFYDNHLGATDLQYTEWKIQSAQMATDKPFDEWLKGR